MVGNPDNEGPQQANVLVFVYGSLKRGFALHSYLADQKFLGERQTAPYYQLFDCGCYPAIVRVPANGVCVKGELYDVTPACLAELDIVEAVSEGLYERDRIELQPPFEGLDAQSYFYLHSTSKLADCGTCWTG